ncbi:molybdopterin-guanine dinucleotide biosynthesis protein B [Gilliamella sp. B2776]|uniref:molybdopterin-guanine dinucleotide biosynthesis protein B n=1 Tax=unclassified Gilliamella TaxID=2685620 RepID=UPI00226A39E8|nr:MULTISPECIES: molybdopterin-guanine dinucleotide biosynthesis protein B [unclassified Gilliamella]MCX8649932.1 molybdopterin-guanine dinucleotide biosynthesis protein B [Gilliamella sp. B2779]MCX8653558.1 molybdopterin-guanine dinucleotide biosynthesis protein B [Gilliamella sp. B2737]MCX8656252.1 molybdopterin-guanine dinucleotide biosynthesis protein B [Gilliamella sp. B2894]MCX8664440.1 molybdopterin-guanine dinucleotide biosynthesis protein B [Gilliamella sp. B2887]MCX8691705.1 molybdop
MNRKKIIGITGYSGSGKTTLLTKVISLLVEQGFKVATLKHAHHDIELDIPGKDSYKLRKAGSLQTIVACNNRYAFICETPNKSADLSTLINQFSDVDIILIEGFKDEIIPKIICHRSTTEKPLFIDEFTIAVASDMPLDTALPGFDINEPIQIVEFIKSYFSIS